MNLLKNSETVKNSLIEYTRNWQEIIDTFPYPVFIVDTDFNIIKLNRATTALCGSVDHSSTLKCYQLIHRSAAPINRCPLEKTIKSGDIEQTEIYEPVFNKFIIINTAPIIQNGNILGAIHSIIDVSKQRELWSDNNELIEIYASSINDLKARELRAQKGRDAFLNMLEDINESYKELEDLFMKLILVMVNALDAKSPRTKGHSERVSMYAELIAQEMLIDADEVRNIKLAGLLHDIGKIGTYDYLLDKPGKLTEEEFEIVKKHPAQGAEILKEIKQLKDVIPLIKYHHERFDGGGYPNKLSGKKIPLGARILHVADSFDSMTSDRPYRPAPGIEYALSELEKHKGTHFDPRVVDAFLRVLKKSKDWGSKLTLLSK
jgi:putative nucleotidyltransferase with HDIG domain